MRVLWLALVLVASAALPAIAQSGVPSPRHFTVVFENSQVRVLRAKVGAGDRSEPHELRNAVAVPLTDYEVKVTTADGASQSAERKAGVPVWLPASSRVVEVGNQPAEAIVVELKSARDAASTK
jgi:hypothetical protein